MKRAGTLEKYIYMLTVKLESVLEIWRSASVMIGMESMRVVCHLALLAKAQGCDYEASFDDARYQLLCCVLLDVSAIFLFKTAENCRSIFLVHQEHLLGVEYQR